MKVVYLIKHMADSRERQKKWRRDKLPVLDTIIKKLNLGRHMRDSDYFICMIIKRIKFKGPELGKNNWIKERFQLLKGMRMVFRNILIFNGPDLLIEMSKD